MFAGRSSSSCTLMSVPAVRSIVEWVCRKVCLPTFPMPARNAAGFSCRCRMVSCHRGFPGLANTTALWIRTVMSSQLKTPRPTISLTWRPRSLHEVEPIRLRLNVESRLGGPLTINALVVRYKEQELPERHSTRRSYLSELNRWMILRWGDYLFDDVKSSHLRPPFRSGAWKDIGV